MYSKVLYDASGYQDDFTLLADARHMLYERLGISFEIEHFVACHILGKMIVTNIENSKLKEHFWNNLESLYKINGALKPNAKNQEMAALEQIKTIEGLNDDDIAREVLKNLVESRKKVAGEKTGKKGDRQSSKDEIFQPIIEKLKEMSSLENN